MFYLLCLIFLFSCNKTEPTKDGDGWRTRIIEGRSEAINEGDIEMSEIPEAPIYPVLIGGAPADRKDWPASFTSFMGNTRCTATVIGPKTLQLAAHCVGNGKTASINVKGTKHSAKCTHHPRYRNDATADYALCAFQEPVELPWYESILTDENAIKVGDKLLLAGMGCTKPGGGGGNDDVFRVGEAEVVRLPKSSNDIVTKGNVALCFGDSGGSVFWKDPVGVYRIAGINSRGDIRTTSYLSAVFTKDGKSFYESWAAQNQAIICGLSPEAKNCRGQNQEPDPTPVPPWCAETLKKVNMCIYGNPREALTDVEGCREAYAQLFACQQAAETE